MARKLLVSCFVRRLIRAVLVIALSSSSCGGAYETCTELDSPVIVQVINAETGRFISGATVRVGEDGTSIDLMETMRGQYSIWSDLPGVTVTATHSDYYEAKTTLAEVSTECSSTLRATISMHRKLPCTSYVAGVRAAAHDAEDGVPIAGATVRLTDGPYAEQMIEMAPGVYEGAYDRPGVYRVEAHASGYRETIAESVWVAEDDCSVLTSAVVLSLPRAAR